MQLPVARLCRLPVRKRIERMSANTALPRSIKIPDMLFYRPFFPLICLLKGAVFKNTVPSLIDKKFICGKSASAEEVVNGKRHALFSR